MYEYGIDWWSTAHLLYILSGVVFGAFFYWEAGITIKGLLLIPLWPLIGGVVLITGSIVFLCKEIENYAPKINWNRIIIPNKNARQAKQKIEQKAFNADALTLYIKEQKAEAKRKREEWDEPTENSLC